MGFKFDGKRGLVYFQKHKKRRSTLGHICSLYTPLYWGCCGHFAEKAEGDMVISSIELFPFSFFLFFFYIFLIFFMIFVLLVSLFNFSAQKTIRMGTCIEL